MIIKTAREKKKSERRRRKKKPNSRERRKIERRIAIPITVQPTRKCM
jgi:hypothetical protein